MEKDSSKLAKKHSLMYIHRLRHLKDFHGSRK